ncbi:DUF3240 domain-containing protein [Guyparkeria halophila]|uniref:DUF3240 domain-containing protein n=1 Tax=Guyparkeria halophila TaxID=47960 RepID=A0A6I6D1S8_9GAMM|nr:DUF3240 family protein [Guyparkeria halophila]QGT78195.1 DUF3240 domain-containing protein [Guyparkeria halophila]
MTDVLLTLIARPDVEELVVDWLLGREELSGFTGEAAWGHSREHGRFNLVEQVTGRQRRAVFHLQIDSTQAEPLITAMRGELSGLGLRYWLVPLLDSGAIE